MRKLPNPNQLDLLAWQPPSAILITHPAKWRAIWVPIVDEIATAIIDKPEKTGMYLANVPHFLMGDLRKAGANEREIAREVAKYQQSILLELGRRQRGIRQAPGAA